MRASGYKTVFFDLDHTLWDFKTNSQKVLKELFTEAGLHRKGLDFQEFYQVYNQVNDQKWTLYRQGRIDKFRLRKERFVDTLLHFSIDERQLGEYFESQYVERSPRQTALMPGAIEVLNYLYEKYQLAIITNGFTSVQMTKLKFTGLEKYFTTVITSEMAGANKPEAKIFVAALKQTATKRPEAVMIGDHIDADVVGAKNAGIDQIWYNQEEIVSDCKPTHQIRELTEIIDLL
ncbi:YjjG family noncanonical pyrimidine nucleotidase [Schleiferia thermophila]|jgi:putative hydrolase of the HAD superfamily|uniref:YjjG family noncanonical pyrimidine nucleotidase n=1 Tax=Schleiferia thermophila TaxID=884107 RepID=UPI0004E66948|nr:YjjG family noncanonical pyrimidine nucleotidase [Schleiferia thermophila]KFD40021.1 haloacid dehalogenase [Schleiferia thermophila str. Yellowstone]